MTHQKPSPDISTWMQGHKHTLGHAWPVRAAPIARSLPQASLVTSSAWPGATMGSCCFPKTRDLWCLCSCGTWQPRRDFKTFIVGLSHCCVGSLGLWPAPNGGGSPSCVHQAAHPAWAALAKEEALLLILVPCLLQTFTCAFLHRL